MANLRHSWILHRGHRRSEIGSVDDFLFSGDDSIIRWAVIDTGNWLPGRQVLLPPNRLILPNANSDSISVAPTQKQVEDSPEIGSDPPVSRQQEMRIYSRYGWDPYWASMSASAALGGPAMIPPGVEPRPMEPLGETGDPTLTASRSPSSPAKFCRNKPAISRTTPRATALISRLAAVIEHRSRMAERPAVRKAIAEEGGQQQRYLKPCGKLRRLLFRRCS